MHKHKPNLWFFMNNKGFADAGGNDDKGGDDKGKTGGGETVSKEEFDKLIAANEKLTKDLDDVRMEVLTPEYMNFLEGGKKDDDKKGDDKGDDKSTDKTISDDDFAKMTPRQIYEKAKADAIEAVRGHVDKVKEDVSKSDKEAKASEVARFARQHDDFSVYRPVMYGLSLDPKNKDLSLQELYDKSKEHVKRIHTGSTEKEKEASKRTLNEKPDGDSESFDRLRKLSPGAAASEALSEVKEKLGPIPSA